MRKINKVDYFCGAFLSYLISNKVEPTLFEAGEKSKIVEFTIRNHTYKVFLKYSTKKSEVTKQKKVFERWNITFVPTELERLKQFNEESKVVYIVCICTDDKLRDPDIAVLSYEDAIKCLGLFQDEKNKQRRITVLHQKSSSKLLCYGTAVSDENAIPVPHDFEQRFDLGKSET